MSEQVTIDLNTMVQRNTEKFIANQLGEELVMMNNETGNFLSINSVGADIWNMLENPMQVSAILQQLSDRYDISAEQCKNETLTFLANSNKQHVFLFS